MEADGAEVIRSLHVVNFESHRDSTLRLSRGLNVLVGLTDAGKSSLFRALRWLMFNRPTGDWMLPLFKKSPGWTEVSVTLSDGTTVTRRKKGGGGEYEVNGKRLTGFGKEVPKDVSDALRMDEINFQPQIDLPFLMFDSPGERSRMLNRVAGLEDIDRCLAAADTDTRRVRQELEQEKKTLVELRIEEERFEDLDVREKLVRKAESVDEEIRQSTENVSRLSDLILSLSRIDVRLDTTKKQLEAFPFVRRAKQLRFSLNKLRAFEETLQGNLQKIQRIEGRIKEMACRVDENLGRQLQEASSILQHLDTIRARKQELENVRTALLEIEKGIGHTQDAYDELVRNLPKRCPVCQRPLNLRASTM